MYIFCQKIKEIKKQIYPYLLDWSLIIQGMALHILLFFALSNSITIITTIIYIYNALISMIFDVKNKKISKRFEQREQHLNIIMSHLLLQETLFWVTSR